MKIKEYKKLKKEIKSHLLIFCIYLYLYIQYHLYLYIYIQHIYDNFSTK